MSPIDDCNNDLLLVEKAIGGDIDSQKIIYTQIEPVIHFQTSQFCKRFCRGQSNRLQCSLVDPIGTPPSDAASCEWGNASYGWMLGDLASPQRLSKYQGRNNSRLFSYLYNIANSLPFYERWKDWRFGRRKRVPEYILNIDPQAARVFYAMSADQNSNMIAAQLSLPIEKVLSIGRAIVGELSRRQKLYLLDTPIEISMTASKVSDENGTVLGGHQEDIPVDDVNVETSQRHSIMNLAWQQLEVVEQFVIEALVIEEQDASDVLDALATLDISIKAGIAPRDCNRQQLYYFKRKALDKLQKIFQEKGYGLDDFFK